MLPYGVMGRGINAAVVLRRGLQTACAPLHCGAVIDSSGSVDPLAMLAFVDKAHTAIMKASITRRTKASITRSTTTCRPA
jgi:hypothetical protein